MDEHLKASVLVAGLSLIMLYSGCIAPAQTTGVTATTFKTTVSTAIPASAPTTTLLAGECESDSDCATGGCSGQICDTKEKAAGVVTTCEMRPEYECLRLTSCGCVDGKCVWKPTPGFYSCWKEKTSPKSGEGSPKVVFASYGSPVTVSANPRVPEYALPLASASIVNYAKVKSKVDFTSGERSLLDNGFTVTANPFNPREEDITQMYKTLKDEEIPVFITTDSLLHLYHIQFDETLRIIEERQFYDYAWNISIRLYNENINEYRRMSSMEYEKALPNTYWQTEAYRRNAAFFAVALELLKPRAGQYCANTRDWECMMSGGKFADGEQDKYTFTVPAEIKSDVDAELALIDAHSGFNPSPVFKYKEDYSQYLPRGHYTRSEKLKNYFKALMWYGRISFLLEGKLVSEDEAKIQTLQASLIASQIDKDDEAKSMWDRIYGVTAFYVGFSDDLGPYEYAGALDRVFSGGFTPAQYTADKYGLLKVEMASYRSPKIYGGTGDCIATTPAEADECLEDTKGFRLMGQRFIPDSYMFQNLVYPKVEGRFFPKGLDVMALLGSGRAYEILEEEGDTNMSGYTTQFNALKSEFSAFTAEDWSQNLYWSWLHSLKPLLQEYGEGYPTFMQSKAWQEKELNTALASWAELRHDTILYAKQSYTMQSSMPHIPPEKPVVGYVEPVPEFYARLLALTRMTNNGLGEMRVLDYSSKHRLDNLERILGRLTNISARELANEELTQEDYDFIKDFGSQLNGVIADVDDKAKKTTMIADVHTDANSGRVLEEGVGYVDMVLVAYRVPDGRVILGAGPVFTYYEFTQPMSDRLTDEKWRQTLQSSPPAKPDWME